MAARCASISRMINPVTPGVRGLRSPRTRRTPRLSESRNVCIVRRTGQKNQAPTAVIPDRSQGRRQKNLRLWSARQRQYASELLRHRTRLSRLHRGSQSLQARPVHAGHAYSDLFLEAIDSAKPDLVLILPWNLKQEIVAQMRHVGDWAANSLFRFLKSMSSTRRSLVHEGRALLRRPGYQDPRIFRKRPKANDPVGNQPILWHLMHYYSQYGHTDFILCLGYKANFIKEFFLNYKPHVYADCVVSKFASNIELLSAPQTDWRISLIDSGIWRKIGQRLWAVREHVRDESMFLANYSDGLSDVDLDDMIARFKKSGKLACFLAIRPPLTYHLADIDERGHVRNSDRRIARRSGSTADISCSGKKSSITCAKARSLFLSHSSG